MRKIKGAATGGSKRAQQSGPYSRVIEKRGRGNFRFNAEGAGSVPAISKDRATGGHSIFVGNIPFSVDWRALKDHMGGAEAGVLRVDVATRGDGASRGFATVQMASAKAMRYAIQNLNESDLEGRSIIVKEDRGTNNSGSDRYNNRGARAGGEVAPAAEDDDGYSRSGTVGRNGWVKPDVSSFVDDGPPPAPRSRDDAFSLSR